MNFELGNNILKEVRDRHRMHKSLDKEYCNRGDWAPEGTFVGNPYEGQSEARWMEFTRRHLRRNCYNVWARFRVQHGLHRVFDSNDLARAAGEKVLRTEHYYCLASIGGLANHHFCVAGYIPDNGSPNSVEDMSDYDGSALVIDPWMNICCNFTEYHVKAKQKFMFWSFHDKRVIKQDTVFDPIDWAFVVPFFTGPLRFELHEVQLPEDRLYSMKSAATRL